MTAKAKITAIGADGELYLDMINAEMSKFRLNGFVEVSTIRNLSKEQEIFSRLRALWYILLKELTKQTGYSEQYWKKKLKTNAGFFSSVREPDGTVTRELKSVADGECTLQELSDLFSHSFYWLLEKQAIELGPFQQKYFELKGRELIGG